MHRIPFHKIYITEDEISEVLTSIESGWTTMGPKTIEFEKNISDYMDCKYSISVNSCTAALHLSLKVIGLKAHDGVIVPSMTFTSSAEVVCYFSANPIIIDVEKDTLNIDPQRFIEKLEENSNSNSIKAVIPVHHGGLPCDMDKIMKISKKYNLKIIEDAAHALPAWFKGKKIGTIGDLTCFSFYATKTLSTGEGGMITTDNEEWAKRIKTLRLHGITTDAWDRYTDQGSWYYEVVETGYKYNMSDLNAALGLAQLKKLEWMWKKRKRIAKKYTEAFSSIDEIFTPPIFHDRESAWHLYVIKLNIDMLKISRNEFIEKMKEKGIGTSVHFIPLYRHPFYRKTFGYDPKDFPNSEWLYERIVSLPIYPGMTDYDIETVIESVYDIVKANRK